MKTLQRLLLVAVLCFSPACASLKKYNDAYNSVTTTEITPETSATIVDVSEKTAGIAAATFTQFLKLDRRYHDIVKAKAPNVHVAANYLRQPMGSPPLPRNVYLLKKLRTATEAFRLNQTEAGAANLRTALAVIKGLLADTQENITRIQTITN